MQYILYKLTSTIHSSVHLYTHYYISKVNYSVDTCTFIKSKVIRHSHDVNKNILRIPHLSFNQERIIMDKPGKARCMMCAFTYVLNTCRHTPYQSSHRIFLGVGECRFVRRMGASELHAAESITSSPGMSGAVAMTWGGSKLVPLMWGCEPTMIAKAVIPTAPPT